ncbi:MAG TPA: TatD family hydrolase [Bryobacteraceae bacterium]
MTLELVDSHCHLDDEQFDADRAAVVDRAREAGVKHMLAIGADAAIALAEQYPFVFVAVGIHPNESATFLDVRHFIKHPKVKAIGEIGLDYHWSVPKETQMPVFLNQLEIAEKAQLPIVIHTRDAWTDTLDVLRAHWKGNPCVVHCFTGNTEQARECLDLGFYLALGGVATFPKSAELRDAARIIPADRLLLETDAPYLAPAPKRGKRNEPAFVQYTAQAVADARGIPVEELAAQTTANFERLFSI